jgi:hypothetical protein
MTSLHWWRLPFCGTAVLSAVQHRQGYRTRGSKVEKKFRVWFGPSEKPKYEYFATIAQAIKFVKKNASFDEANSGFEEKLDGEWDEWLDLDGQNIHEHLYMTDGKSEYLKEGKKSAKSADADDVEDEVIEEDDDEEEEEEVEEEVEEDFVDEEAAEERLLTVLGGAGKDDDDEVAEDEEVFGDDLEDDLEEDVKKPLASLDDDIDVELDDDIDDDEDVPPAKKAPAKMAVAKAPAKAPSRKK